MGSKQCKWACNNGGIQKCRLVRSQNKKVEKYLQRISLQTDERDGGSMGACFCDETISELYHTGYWIQDMGCFRLVLLIQKCEEYQQESLQENCIGGDPYRKPSAGCKVQPNVRRSI